MSFKQAVIDGAFRLQPRAGTVDGEGLALLAIGRDGTLPTPEQRRLAQRNRRSTFNGLFERQDEMVRRGMSKTFEIDDAATYRIRWASFADPIVNMRLSLRSTILSWLDGLTDREYEYAAGIGMLALGASEVLVTPKGDDFGLDFFALVPAYAKSRIFLSGPAGLRIIGQAKKYSNPVVREKVQAYNNAFDSVRHNRGEMNGMIPSWFLSSSAPMVGCFLAQSGFQDGSLRMCKQNGHLMLDSLQLAEILSRPKIFGYMSTPSHVERILWSQLKHVSSM